MKRRELLAALALLPAPAWAGALPPRVHGIPGRVRISGSHAIAPFAWEWKRAFEAARPEIKVDVALAGSDVAMANLYTATCDIALIGRDATKPEVQAFEWIYRFRPKGIAVLNGSVATPGQSPALAAMVHRSNPLAVLSLDQLRAAFGDSGTRARTWGELGLGGAWRDQPINLYAPEAESGTGRYFRETVLDGSNRMAWPRMREFVVPPRPPKADKDAAEKMRRALMNDPAGLAIGVAGDGIRTVPLLSADGLPVLPEVRQIIAGNYPLARKVRAYYAAPSASGIHPETLAFLRFILTEDAQALAQKASGYLRLSAGAATRERAALG